MTRSPSSLVLKRIEEREAGRVAYVTVNNPEKRNALGIAGKQGLTHAFKQLARDETLRVAVLTGAGERSFIAGADLAEMKDLTPKDTRQVKGRVGWRSREPGAKNGSLPLRSPVWRA